MSSKALGGANADVSLDISIWADNLIRVQISSTLFRRFPLIFPLYHYIFIIPTTTLTMPSFAFASSTFSRKSRAEKTPRSFAHLQYNPPTPPIGYSHCRKSRILRRITKARLMIKVHFLRTVRKAKGMMKSGDQENTMQYGTPNVLSESR